MYYDHISIIIHIWGKKRHIKEATYHVVIYQRKVLPVFNLFIFILFPFQLIKRQGQRIIE